MLDASQAVPHRPMDVVGYDVDFLAFTITIPGMLRLIGLGSFVIVLAVPTIAWWIRRKRRNRSFNATAA